MDPTSNVYRWLSVFDWCWFIDWKLDHSFDTNPQLCAPRVLESL